MTRNEFIEKLTTALSVRMSADMTAELIEDFNAHFDEALKAGKSEEAVCEFLGDPAEIAVQCFDMEPPDAERYVGQDSAYQEAELRRNLSIKLKSWNLQCAPWDGEKFRIAVMIGEKAIPDPRVRIEEKENGLYITQLPDDDFPWIKRFFLNDGQRTLKVAIPRSFKGEIDAYTGSGNINFSELALEGKLHAQTGSGNVSLAGVSSGETFSCHTGSGNIRLNDCSGTGDFHTGSGNITASGHRGTIGARAGSGNLRLETDSLSEETKFETGSGNVHISAASLSADLKLRSGSGNIIFEIRELRGNITGDTGSGNIRGVLSAGTKARFILRTAMWGSKVHNDFENDDLPNDLPVVELKTGVGSLRIEKIQP
ncbi:MAG: DUF4097 family beta strand repeat-containing protein [Treponema sp.]|jgi:hypothetical protein|nr:DUF4097 family beta strand repeat-containing protein [Treponema sp.]